MGILLDGSEMTQDRLVAEIERLIGNQFDKSAAYQRHDPNQQQRDLSPMFKRNLTTFTRYLDEEFSPKIKKLQDVFYKYTFESPLNFIMVKSDFKRFYESFTQARLSLLYSLELHKDSMFNVDWQRQHHQLNLSAMLYKNFEAQVSEMGTILEEYHHLLVHDNFDCSTHMRGERFMFTCWFRRYGCPLACAVALVMYAYLMVVRQLNISKKNKQMA